MRILMVSYWDFQERGMQVTRKTPLHFARRGHEVTFITHAEMTEGPIDSVPTAPGLEYRRLRLPFGFLRRIPIVGRLRLLGGFAASVGAFVLRRRLAGQKFDLVYGAECDAIFIARALATFMRVPLVTRYYGISEMMLRRTGKHQLYKLSLRVPTDLCIVTDDGTHGDVHVPAANNRISRFQFWRNGVDPFRPDPAACDALREEHGLDDFDLVLMTASRLYPWKRVDRGVRAVAGLKERGVKAKLLILGGGPAHEELQSLAEQLGVADRVTVVGPVSHEQVYAYYAVSDVCLALHEMASLGNQAWECLNSGTVLITVEGGGSEDLLASGENGLCLPWSGDEEDLHRITLDALERFARDAAHLQQVKEGALETGRKCLWSWEERLDAELSELAELAGKASVETAGAASRQSHGA